jgi:biopolymer transport protein TolR
MQLGEPARIRSAINVTPLVDVVLVLLIIFMVMAPYMRKGPGPEVDLPATANPREQGDDGARIQVTIDERGALWVEDQPVTVDRLGEGLRAAADGGPNPRVVIRGDARLRFGDVRRTLLVIEEAGFRGAGLIAERAGARTQGG